MSKVNDVPPEGRVRPSVNLIEKWLKEMAGFGESSVDGYLFINRTIKPDLRKVIDRKIKSLKFFKKTEPHEAEKIGADARILELIGLKQKIGLDE